MEKGANGFSHHFFFTKRAKLAMTVSVLVILWYITKVYVHEFTFQLPSQTGSTRSYQGMKTMIYLHVDE